MSRTIGTVVWFVGLSGSGKTTIGRIVSQELQRRNIAHAVLDGDELRQALSSDLGFSRPDRMKHIQRTLFVAQLLSRNGIVVLVPLITPYKEMREQCRASLPSYAEVYVKCPLERCIERDVKGLYRKALAGEIPHFTGIDDRFDEPDSPDLTIETDGETPASSAGRIMELLRRRGVKLDE
ncbi:adenylyl-sulfate kinase [Cohnella boryungensis]|uniref:Adenylyl-sulfate kinase n=1 Tax=Cohnella boryungensis TaxID=768479 RepID=A0ABV8S4C2_9BACL